MDCSISPKAKKTKPAVIPSYNGPKKDEVIKKRKIHLSEGQYTFFKDPVMIVEGAMQYVFDEHGRRYLDAYSNVCHIGHCHPHVVGAVQDAISTVLTNTRYLHPGIVKYAAKLKSWFPKELNTCFFVNSGSEANDLAVRLARVYTKKKGIVVLEDAYHGVTATCTGMSTCVTPGAGAECPDLEYNSRDIHVAPRPDLLRGPYKYDDDKAGHKYAKLLEKTIEEKCSGDLAAFVYESVQGVGGQIFYPEGYIKSCYELVRNRGGLCIADEVQVGFGRCGTYWMFEQHGVVPDIVTLGKPIGNGFPLAAVIVKRDIAEAFNDCQYFNTAGGNPVACAAGLAVLEAMEENKTMESASKLGIKLLNELNNLKTKHPNIADVRGKGLFIGIEFVKDLVTLEPDPELCSDIIEKCKQLGVLMGKAGRHANVIALKPPMCINKDDVQLIVTVLDKALSEKDTDFSNTLEKKSAPPSPSMRFAVMEYLRGKGMLDLAQQFAEQMSGNADTSDESKKKKKKKKTPKSLDV